MFHADERLTPFEKKIWLSSPTMHGPELEYIKDAYEKNWMSTVGENINEVERLACETVGCKYAVALATGHLCPPPGREAGRGKARGEGVLLGHDLFCHRKSGGV